MPIFHVLDYKYLIHALKLLSVRYKKLELAAFSCPPSPPAAVLCEETVDIPHSSSRPISAEPSEKTARLFADPVTLSQTTPSKLCLTNCSLLTVKTRMH